MKKFQNKYRIPTARAAWWDFGPDAACFVTPGTAHRIHFFWGNHDATPQY